MHSKIIKHFLFRSFLLLISIYPLQPRLLSKTDSIQIDTTFITENVKDLSVSRPDFLSGTDSMPKVVPSEISINPEIKTKNERDWNAFLGAALGAFISAFASIGIFWKTNRKQEIKQDKVMKLSLSVIYELCEQSICYLKSYITEIQDIEKQHNIFNKNQKITQALPYKEPYALLRLKNFDIHLFSEIMAKFNVDGFPEMIIEIDFLCHYLQDINEYFRVKDIELRSLSSATKITELYDEIIRDTSGNTTESGPLHILEKHKKNFELFLQKIKNQQ